MTQTITMEISDELAEWIDAYRAHTSWTRESVLRDALVGRGCPSDIVLGRMKEYAVALAEWDKPRMGIYFVDARSEGAALRAAVVERGVAERGDETFFPAGDPREWDRGFDYHYAIAVVESEWRSGEDKARTEGVKEGRREILPQVCNACARRIRESVRDEVIGLDDD